MRFKSKIKHEKNNSCDLSRPILLNLAWPVKNQFQIFKTLNLIWLANQFEPIFYTLIGLMAKLCFAFLCANNLQVILATCISIWKWNFQNSNSKCKHFMMFKSERNKISLWNHKIIKELNSPFNRALNMQV